MIKPVWWGVSVVVLLTILLLYPGFGEILQHPNGYLFSQDGDGLKNYFNLGYYLKFNQGLHFTGINYPYGDNLLFTDSHPFYALFLNLIDNHLWPIAHNSVAIINLSIIGGMVLAALVLFLILHHYQLPVWYAVIVSLSIMFLSPQWDRIHGHLSLSYAFVIPSFWLIILKAEGSERRVFWLVILGTFAFICGGIHLYYLAIGSGFVILYALVSWFMGRHHEKANRSFLFGLMIAAIIPLITVFLISHWSDFINDRPVSPYGFYVYHATIESVFFPHAGSMLSVLSGLFNPSINWEGRAFVGTIPLIFVFGFIMIKVSSLFNGKIPSGNLLSDQYPFGVAAAIMLLFSMCVPFEFGFQFIPEWISPLKQFRALGRFSWPFYYVVNVLAATYFYRFANSIFLISHGGVRIAFFAVILMMMIFDAGSFYSNHGPISISKNDKLENTSQAYLDHFTSSGTHPSHFQAIFSLPIVAVRTDKLTFEQNLSAHNEAMKCAFHTGLPIVQSTESRPSLSQTLSSIQFLSSAMISKSRLQDMDQRPLLLLYTIGSELKEEEKKLLDQGELFWQDEYIQLHRLPLSVFNDSLHVIDRKIISLIRSQDSVETRGDLICQPNCDGVIYHSFENEKSNLAFYGNGSRHESSQTLVLLDTFFPVSEQVVKEASFWIYVDPGFPGMPSYEYFSGANANELTSSGRQETRELTEIFGRWAQVKFNLSAGNYHRIILYNRHTTVDNLLIKSRNQDILVNNGVQKTYNNYLVP